MKETIVNDILHNWYEKYGDNFTGKYTYDKLTEIAITCASLSETWFSKQKTDDFSFEVALYDKDGAIVDTLDGITMDNLPSTMFNVTVLQSDTYSKLSLMRFRYINGKKTTELVGELEIS